MQPQQPNFRKAKNSLLVQHCIQSGIEVDLSEYLTIVLQHLDWNIDLHIPLESAAELYRRKPQLI